jgi:hypothetical protein
LLIWFGHDGVPGTRLMLENSGEAKIEP